MFDWFAMADRQANSTQHDGTLGCSAQALGWKRLKFSSRTLGELLLWTRIF